MRSVEKTAKTIDEAIELALNDLNIKKENAKIDILEEPSKGFLGIIGSKDAKVRVEEIEEVKEKESKKIAYEFLRNVLNAMDVKAEIRIKETPECLYIDLTGPRMGIIIGRRGQTLDALQYLLTLVVNKNSEREDYIRIILDTENYRRKREETLERLANRLAGRVVKSNRKVELEPMNPYERRIIHYTLQNYPGVITYSEGEEPFRKVIIDCK
ncbi:MAG: protein jag [Clostridiales bacterium]|nr:protein jag [Clostridiales bacterium]